LWLLLTGTIAAQLINPQIIRRFLDAAEAGQPLPVLLGAAGLFLAVALVEQLLGLLTTYASANVGWLATNRLREEVVFHCLHLDLGFHKQHPPGELIERIDGDINQLGNFYARLALNLLNNLLLLAGVLLLLWFEEWRIGLAITGLAAFGLAAINALRIAATPYWQQARQAMADLYGFLEERLHGMEDIRANGAAAYTLQRLYAMLQRLYAAEFRPRLLGPSGLMAPILTFGLAYAAVYLLGDALYRQGQLSIGTVYLVVYYLGLLSTPLWQIANEIQDLQTAGASIHRVQELLETQSRIADEGTSVLASGPLALAFEQVSVRYEESGEPVLREVSFRLEAGAVLGLLGRTGSGKTTLTRLLLRLVEPESGVVRLGDEGIDLAAVPLPELRRHVGMVTQEVQLFHATIRDNLTFFDEKVDDAALLAMARRLGLDEWLASLPAGLDTLVGAGGQGLSAGEAQLVAFLRIGLQEPGLAILDEPSSRLDPATERLLDRAITRLLHGRTGILIAHRLETIGRVDQVLILEEGRVREFGDRALLAAQPDSYLSALLRAGAVGVQP
jgi:ABC-type multidrug transport system fused ATPase/permease subunit